MQLLGPLKARHVLRASMRIGSAVARLQRVAQPAWHERIVSARQSPEPLMQISMD